MPLDDFTPEDKGDFSFLLQALVGPAGIPAAGESLQFTVCTPLSLGRQAAEDGVLFGRSLVIVETPRRRPRDHSPCTTGCGRGAGAHSGGTRPQAHSARRLRVRGRLTVRLTSRARGGASLPARPGLPGFASWPRHGGERPGGRTASPYGFCWWRVEALPSPGLCAGAARLHEIPR
ncbi:Imm8 family immunity protein [Streptomyces tendae]|uniref:Imm8 family immunity protein n=1 Tax=Streptomyces tendae TaxID=1932 RepID=UPI0037125281